MSHPITTQTKERWCAWRVGRAPNGAPSMELRAGKQGQGRVLESCSTWDTPFVFDDADLARHCTYLAERRHCRGWRVVEAPPEPLRYCAWREHYNGWIWEFELRTGEQGLGALLGGVGCIDTLEGLTRAMASCRRASKDARRQGYLVKNACRYESDKKKQAGTMI